MSTNDTVFLWPTGNLGLSSRRIPGSLQEALNRICYDLAHKIVSDGERITKVVRVEVSGAPSDEAAEKVCRAIGNSLPSKPPGMGTTQIGDGSSMPLVTPAGIQMEKIDLHYNDTFALLRGAPQTQHRQNWKTAVSQDSFTIRQLNLGEGSGWILSTDLTEAT